MIKESLLNIKNNFWVPLWIMMDNSSEVTHILLSTTTKDSLTNILYEGELDEEVVSIVYGVDITGAMDRPDICCYKA